MATVVYASNPLDFSQREVKQSNGILAQLAPVTPMPFICMVNGEYILRKDWGRVVHENDLVVFASVLQGGGNGGGKNILRLVATIALAVYAPQFAGQFYAAGTAGNIATSVAFSLAGNILLNAVMPPPKLPSSQQSANLSAPSPTYSLGSQANSARIGSAVPVIYGRHRIYPDLGDQPLAYNPTPKIQTLMQMFVVGQGQYVLSDFGIEDSPISSFKESEIYPLGPNQPNVLGDYTGIYNCAEVAGQEVPAPSEGSNVWLGPFVINPPAKPIVKIHIEVAFPKGLYGADDLGELRPRTLTWTAQARLIDEDGVALGSWQTLGDESATFADSTPLRISDFYDVAAGRYEVRLARTNAKDDSLKVANDIVWSGAAGISNQPATDFVNGLTRVQVLLQATDNLNSNTARRFNLIAQRQIKEWHPVTGWSELKDSRSIVWAFVDILKSRGRPDKRINLTELYELDVFYKARRMFFDAVFDNKISMFEALNLVARAGRAVPMEIGGQYTLVRDTKKTMPVALFSMRNIVKGSFSVNYAMPTEESANAVLVDYIDGTTFKPAQIKVEQPDTAGDIVSQVQLFGVTDPENARLEAQYLVASNWRRRRTVKFTTEMDGFICRFGDLVLVSHDLPSWGISGDVIDFDEETLTATVSEAVTFGEGNHYIRLQSKNGQVSEAYLVTVGENEFEVVFEELPDPLPYTGSQYEQSRFTFGGSIVQSQLVKIKSIQPRGIDSVEITGVIDDDRVYEFAGDDLTQVNEQAPPVYAPDDFTSSYLSASDEQKASYGFWANARGLMSNKDTSYLYQSEA